MRRSVSVILILFWLLPITLATTWRRVGLGRVVHAFPHASSALLVTELGVLARLSADKGLVLWRSAPLTAGVQLNAVAFVRDSLKGAVLAVSSSDGRVIAFAVENGDTLWQRTGCNVRNGANARAIVQKCGAGQETVNAATGEIVSDEEGDKSYPVTSTWTVEGSSLEPELRWAISGGELRSFADGRLAMFGSGGEIWVREEGLAHLLDAALYSPGNVSKDESVLVALSELGAVFGLDAADEGKLLWKTAIGKECRLVIGHADVAVVVCTREAVTDVVALKTESGEAIMRESVDGFVAKQAVVEDRCCADEEQVCVRLLNAGGEERTIASSKECALLTTISGRGWLSFEKLGSAVRGLSDGKKTWHVDMPSGSVIVAVEAGRQLHPSSSRVRPPAVRVTGDRRVLFKHVGRDIVLVLAINEKKALVHAILVDAKTGSLCDVATHPEAAGTVSAVRGESWFVYSFWNTRMLEQEIHVIDMYEPDTEVTRVHHALHGAANAALGPQLMSALNLRQRVGIDQCLAPTAHDSNETQCVVETLEPQNDGPKTPVILRSSMLTTKRIVGLDVTETTLGLTEPSIVMTLESGQVALVSKILLDARRPKGPDGFIPTEYLIPYRPLLNLQSTSPESQYIAVGEHVEGARIVAVAPAHNRESMCQLAVVGIDILFALLQPVGAFDALPEDFSYLSVVAMILTLGSVFFYTQRMKKKASLSRSW